VADRAVELARGLEAWLAEHGSGGARVELGARATVGFSQETWFARVSNGTGEHDVVLRLPTPASGERAIRAQRAALQTVAGRVPAPALLWHDDGAEHPLGRPFLVMERVHGDVPVGWHELPEPQRSALAREAVAVLAQLHAVAPGELGEGDRGAGPTELAYYRERLARLAPLPEVLEVAVWWLERHAPAAPGRRVLAHGDFRMGNLVVGEGRVRGILDWEMAGVGDPVADLVWCFAAVFEPAGVDEDALVASYERHSGSSVDPERLHWHRVLAYVRLAYYALAGTAAFDAGRSHDLRLAALRLQLPVYLDRLAATLAGEPVT
jgi:aminoglycoside phosphotransferase (APT) family kinase protein